MTDNKKLDFIREKIREDVVAAKNDGRIHTRFPPEPNGYLHIGHAKAICLDFGIAEENKNALCNLRLDDTNPETEDTEYVDAIKEDIKWLGFDWEDRLFYASDYFDKFYDYAIKLIKKGLAYVCDLSAEEIREYRGTATEPGQNSPYRNRSVKENIDLFQQMKDGKYEDGSRMLRAKIDMASHNFHMRDPILYRIRRITHHRTADDWCIYPTYDFAHCLSDAIEGITHSLCTLEFVEHRPTYDWILNNLKIKNPPQQIEFARLNLDYTVMSKRKLAQLVNEGYVSGWDDPRMPTLCGLRRRGYPPEVIKTFCETIGITKVKSISEMSLLEYCLRDNLNKHANRAMAVLDPLKIVIDNYPENEIDELDAINNPEDESAGSRKVPFSKIIYIERDDFRESANRKYRRLKPGAEVRLRYGYFITCVDYKKDEETGEVTEVHCTYDPKTRGGSAPDGRKVKGTIHWVSAEHALKAEVRLYDRLFSEPDPANEKDGVSFIKKLNPDSAKIIGNAYIEPSLKKLSTGDKVQFERIGYFCVDKDSTEGKPVFNRTVPLRDSWKKNK
ncbi:MAG: glutamine--tRNA ligase/YqeY domain fusion protein [Verrucomicrobiota bacterium]|nr:glutamine--tRNA ligase/YqeY domain fusion protein [Verrucomicrobiota bacterium]